jgi:hypothetical protein
VPFARCCGDRASPAGGAGPGLQANPPYLRTCYRCWVAGLSERTKALKDKASPRNDLVLLVLYQPEDSGLA